MLVIVDEILKDNSLTNACIVLPQQLHKHQSPVAQKCNGDQWNPRTESCGSSPSGLNMMKVKLP